MKLSDLTLAFATDERLSKDVMFDRFLARLTEALGVPARLIEQAPRSIVNR